VFGFGGGLIDFLLTVPHPDSLRFGWGFGLAGCLIGFLLGRMAGVLRRARKLQALHSTLALILAVVAAVPPVVAGAFVCCGFLVGALLPIPRGGGYQPPSEYVIDPVTGQGWYKPHGDSLARIAWYVALCGAGIAGLALVGAYRAAVKYQEQSGPARPRRRLAVCLALLALALNGAALPWLFTQGWPSPIMQQGGATAPP
jgi:hypothetical protein